MRDDALSGDPIAKVRYEKTLAMRREAYHSKKSEQTAWQYAYDHDTLVAELMRISGSDAIIVLAKEIWYCIDSLTNRCLWRCLDVWNSNWFIKNKSEVYMDYSIRELRQNESKVLNTFLYEAIFIPEGVPIPPKEIINQPELQVYVKDFGKNKGDLCLVAEANNEIVGAVWCRIMNDYGHIDAETPSFAISLLKQYRNYGIGTNLMEQMLKKLKMQGYKQVSLSVQKMNYAVHMYLKVGFESVDENDEEYIMICKL